MLKPQRIDIGTAIKLSLNMSHDLAEGYSNFAKSNDCIELHFGNG